MVFRQLKTAVRVLVSQGPIKGTAALIRAARERYHERRLGISTAEVIYLNEFGVTDERCHEYAAVTYENFQTILNHHDIRADQDVFCDFGSGMGRALVLAAEYPFRRVFGVEMIPELHQRATENIERAKPKLACKDVISMVADATKFEIPDDLTVAFFCNPFHGEILDKVLNNLAESIRRAPRIVTFLVQVPLPSPTSFEQTVAGHSWIRETGRYPLRGNCICIVYQTTLPATRG